MNTDWQTLVQAGIDLVQAQDRNRWSLGDLAAITERQYGQASVKKLATEIRMPRHKTLYEYHRVSRFYDLSTREEFPQLSWSHYREAMRLESLSAACAMLAEAHDNDWPVAKLAREIKLQVGEKPAPEKLLDTFARVTSIRGDTITLLVQPGDAQQLRDAYLNNLPLRIAFWIADVELKPTHAPIYILGGGALERRIS